MKKFLAIFFAFIMMFLLCSIAFASYAETDTGDDNESVTEGSIIADASSVMGTNASNSYGLTGGNVRIYTGIGRAQWLHVFPESFNVGGATIKMLDYSGAEVWSDSIDISQVSHWYIGANVKYVNIVGGVGVISVTHTDH